MTYKELYNYAKTELNDSFEAQILCEEILGFSRHEVIINPNKEVLDTKKFITAIENRKSGQPLQYIIGHWEFDGMDLFVKEGVLIPREDTLILAETTKNFIGNKKMTGIDLCSGTGAVALSIANSCENVKITALELYPIPLECLKININKHSNTKVDLYKGDIFTEFPNFKDLNFIVSNPPYIESDEIKTLQIEVQKEPVTALDGGSDGLDFYKFIIENWTSCLKENGLLAFEIGETQGKQVADLMSAKGYKNVKIEKDLSNHDRVVFGIK